MKLKILSLLFIVHCSLFITACGYKPSSHYAKGAIVSDVYVDVEIGVENSTNTVIIKDIINEMIIGQFGATLTNQKANANTLVKAKFGSISHIALETDNEGYTKTYRTNVTINFEYHNKVSGKKDKLSVSNYYDYGVEKESVLSNQKKEEAIKFASQKALEDLFSKIAVRNY